MYIGGLWNLTYLKSTDSDNTQFGIPLDSNDSKRKLTDNVTSTWHVYTCSMVFYILNDCMFSNLSYTF